MALTNRPLGVVAAVVLLGVAHVWAFTGSESTVAAVPGVQVSPDGVYNPVTAGEQLPEGFRQLLPRDAILPVYEPEFVGAEDVFWPLETQVIAVEFDGDARAYPVSFLNGREMVIDDVGDVPIVVTW